MPAGINVQTFVGYAKYSFTERAGNTHQYCAECTFRYGVKGGLPGMDRSIYCRLHEG